MVTNLATFHAQHSYMILLVIVFSSDKTLRNFLKSTSGTCSNDTAKGGFATKLGAKKITFFCMFYFFIGKHLSDVGFEPTPTYVDQNTPVWKSFTLESGALDRSASLTCRFMKNTKYLFKIKTIYK